LGIALGTVKQCPHTSDQAPQHFLPLPRAPRIRRMAAVRRPDQRRSSSNTANCELLASNTWAGGHFPSSAANPGGTPHPAQCKKTAIPNSPEKDRCESTRYAAPFRIHAPLQRQCLRRPLLDCPSTQVVISLPDNRSPLGNQDVYDSFLPIVKRCS
jgi:hypothetical protein